MACDGPQQLGKESMSPPGGGTHRSVTELEVIFAHDKGVLHVQPPEGRNNDAWRVHPALLPKHRLLI